MISNTARGFARCTRTALLVGVAMFGLSAPLRAQTGEHKAIMERIEHLRDTPDAERGEVTRKLAIQIRSIEDIGARLSLAAGLASLATEGDFGQKTLQEVATTLAQALDANPPRTPNGKPAMEYVTLAQLARYENVTVTLKHPQYSFALAELKSQDRARAAADFTLNDLSGAAWNLKSLKGKVVVVNFWATWCPPCRKEIPDLEALYQKFKDRDLVVLGISDEKRDVVFDYVSKHPMTYPILLDPGRKTNTAFFVAGIPRTFIFDRTGKIAAQAIDMRTERQFLALLEKAGLK